MLTQFLQDDTKKPKFQAYTDIGIHSDIEVVFKSRDNDVYKLMKNPNHLVTQIICSAIDLSNIPDGYPQHYGDMTKTSWNEITKCVLEAMYEATIYAAYLNAVKHNFEEGSKTVYLTFLGSGSFKNNPILVKDAMARAVAIAHNLNLDLEIIVAYPKKDLTDWRDVENQLEIEKFNLRSPFLNFTTSSFYFEQDLSINASFFYSYVQCTRRCMNYTAHQLYVLETKSILKVFFWLFRDTKDKRNALIAFQLAKTFSTSYQRRYLKTVSSTNETFIDPDPYEFHLELLQNYLEHSCILRSNFTDRNTFRSTKKSIKKELRYKIHEIDISHLIVIQAKINLNDLKSMLQFEIKRDDNNVNFKLSTMIVEIIKEQTKYFVAYIFYDNFYTIIDDVENQRQHCVYNKIESMDQSGQPNNEINAVCFYKANYV